MKIKLTKKWKQLFSPIPNLGKSSDAVWNYIYLRCLRRPYCGGIRDEWVGMATLGTINTRVGPTRRSITLAQQDAERLAVELLRDIRDGTRALMVEYEMGEDD